MGGTDDHENFKIITGSSIEFFALNLSKKLNSTKNYFDKDSSNNRPNGLILHQEGFQLIYKRLDLPLPQYEV